MPAVLDPGHQLLLRRRIARQLVRDHDPRRPALLLEQRAQQALGRLLVAPALDQNVEHDAVLIHGTPEIMLLAGDLEHDFIQMPLVAGPGQPPPDDIGELLAELQAPLADGLVADLEAAEGQHLHDHAQGERKAEPEGQRRRR